MEGGGNSGDSKAALRQGMDVFLAPIKEAARSRSWRWKLVCCGSRQDTFNAFIRALDSHEMAVTVLLVDAEVAVTKSACEHLRIQDGWDFGAASDEQVHLMIQTMETWILADIDRLKTYYGSSFNPNPLPRTENLESVAKNEIASALDQATRTTQKGTYHKIRHASDLLARIDREQVKHRCPSCQRLFDCLGRLMNDA